MKEVFVMPDGMVTRDAGVAAEAWARAFYQARDALERLRPIPERLLRREPVMCLEEALAEADAALSLGDRP